MPKFLTTFAVLSGIPVIGWSELAPPEIQRDAKGVVTITCNSQKAVIFYTLDGTEPGPRTGAGVYLGPFSFPYKGCIKATAYELSEISNSSVAAINNTPTPPTTVIPVTQNRNTAWYDWAKRHAEICKNVRARKPSLLFIGDSITHAMDASGKNAAWRKYYEPRNAMNLGFGWDRTENVLWRLQNGELEGAAPKVAVLLIGTNNRDINTPEDIALGIQTICAEIHQRTPSTKILLLGVFPRGEKPDDGRKKIQDLNKILATYDGKDGINFLDIGAKFLNPDGTISKEIMADFLHPTAKGYELWAEAMEPTLRRLLGE